MPTLVEMVILLDAAIAERDVAEQDVREARQNLISLSNVYQEKVTAVEEIQTSLIDSVEEV